MTIINFFGFDPVHHNPHVTSSNAPPPDPPSELPGAGSVLSGHWGSRNRFASGRVRTGCHTLSLSLSLTLRPFLLTVPRRDVGGEGFRAPGKHRCPYTLRHQDFRKQRISRGCGDRVYPGRSGDAERLVGMSLATSVQAGTCHAGPAPRKRRPLSGTCPCYFQIIHP